MISGSPCKNAANAWFNGLTAQQKAAHNTMMRAKDAAAKNPQLHCTWNDQH
jgi:hypothetical protein